MTDDDTARLRERTQQHVDFHMEMVYAAPRDILALLDALDAAKRERDEARAQRDQTAREFDAAWGAAVKANTERDALAADARRYRWLADRVLACDYGDNDDPGARVGWRIKRKLVEDWPADWAGRGPVIAFGPSIDAAIDAAIDALDGAKGAT